MKRFHVHVYFKPEDLERARTLVERALGAGLFDSVKLHERAVGPHPTGMIEMHFGDLSYSSVTEWVEAHRGDFSALIHQDTGDDIRDHTDGIRWLGPELPLDFNFFELIKTRPDLRVHPENTPN